MKLAITWDFDSVVGAEMKPYGVSCYLKESAVGLFSQLFRLSQEPFQCFTLRI